MWVVCFFYRVDSIIVYLCFIIVRIEGFLGFGRVLKSGFSGRVGCAVRFCSGRSFFWRGLVVFELAVGL